MYFKNEGGAACLLCEHHRERKNTHLTNGFVPDRCRKRAKYFMIFATLTLTFPPQQQESKNK